MPFVYNMNFVMEQSSKKLFKGVSMFAGGGGSSTGYRLAGGDILGMNEFIPSAQHTYSANYPNTYVFKQDIRELTGKIILDAIGLKEGELDILDGSPPCSGYSNASTNKKKLRGKVKKYSDSKQKTDDLFLHFGRILSEVKPKVFICENVKGITQGESATILGSEQYDIFGEHKDTIYHTLSESGYNIRYKVLNAENFGVPQNRERIIFIGVRKDIDCNITFPSPYDEKYNIGQVSENIDFISCFRGFKEKSNRIIDRSDVCYTITQDGLGVGRRYRVWRNYFTKDIIPPFDRTRYFSHIDFDGIDYNENESYEAGKRLSMEELKKICSFPSDYILKGSNNKQWERLGRAVPPLMMKAVAQHVYETILKPNIK